VEKAASIFQSADDNFIHQSLSNLETLIIGCRHNNTIIKFSNILILIIQLYNNSIIDSRVMGIPPRIALRRFGIELMAWELRARQLRSFCNLWELQ
jgi:hypothetical protein